MTTHIYVHKFAHRKKEILLKDILLRNLLHTFVLVNAGRIFASSQLGVKRPFLIVMLINFRNKVFGYYLQAESTDPIKST